MFGVSINLYWWQRLLIAIGSIIALHASSSVAQTPDATLPNNSNVKLEGNIRVISGGTTVGANLFHSFSEFSVPTGSGVTFNNALDIQNILTRVTGTEASNIDGLIRASGKANLFLLNPNGISFGKDASLDIGGSFVASTANAIKFDSGFEFSAKAPQFQPLLTISVPVGLQYGDNPGKIKVQESILSVKPSQTLALVGGNINIEGGGEGFLSALGGRIELGGLTSAGIVDIEGQQSENMFKLTSLRFNEAPIRADIFLNNFAYLDVRGSGSGSIAINAQNLKILDDSGFGGSLLLAGIAEGKGTPEAIAGDITLNATEKILVTGNSRIRNNVEPNAVGNAGNINIITDSLELTSGAQLNTGTFGQGNAGNININARDRITFEGRGDVESSGAYTNVETGAIGNGGNINISTGSLFLNNDSILFASTFGKGSAGNVFVKANNIVSLTNGIILSTVESGAVGDGGDININAGSLSLKDGSQLLTRVSEAYENQIAGRGSAGDVNIDVTGEVTIDGIKNDMYPSAIFSNVGTDAIGNGGNINISAGSLSLTNDGYLSASIDPEAKGNGGNITIKTDLFSATTNSALEVSTQGDGTSGNIYITAKEFLLSSNAALIGDVGPTGQGGGNIDLLVDGTVSLLGGTETSITGESTRITAGVQPYGQGKSGNVTIKANSLILKDGAIIKASTQGQGPAGNIDINTNVLDISGSSPTSGLISGLFTSTDSSFKAGDIVINTTTFKIADSAALSASTLSSGQGGNIRVNTRLFEAINGGQLITTTSGSGQAGNIIVNASNQVNISGVDQTYNARIDKIKANEERIRQYFSNPDEASFQLSLIANAIKKTGNKSGLFVNTEPNSTGKGGNINTQQLTVTSGAQITANSQGSGNAGSIEGTFNRMLLDKGATINADTTGDGGNINLQSPLLILRRGSNITTNASGSNITGGNININARNGFVIAIPKENSNIRADSASGRGGNITIKNLAGIFGIQASNQPSGASEITAKGATPQLSGNIQITPPDVNPNNGLIELPITLVDASNQISTACTPGSRQFNNTFTATGRGGLPISPNEPLQDQNTYSAWVRFQTKPESNTVKINQPSLIALAPTIIEASGWITDKSGNIELVAPDKASPLTEHSVSCIVSK
jgi:filamentous hemagglutinin family protein